jgi:hydroxyacylglutathione hydrolase
VNKVGPALLRDLPTGGPLSVADVAAKQAAGTLVIDARPVDEFAQGHIPGVVSIGFGPNFAIWAGWLTPYDREVVLILGGEEQYEEARTELQRIGIDDVVGYLEGGMTSWKAAGKPIESMETIRVKELASRRSAYTVLDVRDRAEWEGGHLPGAINIPAGDLAQGADSPISGAGPVAVICGTGFRSAVASSLLQQKGGHDFVQVDGGMNAWREAGLPTSVNGAAGEAR